MKNWERAFTDFKRAVEIDPTRGIGYIGKGDASRMLGEYEDAVHFYTEAAAIQKPLVAVALLKRAIALAELKRYTEAASDLDTVR